MSLGGRLKELRNKQSLTQQELAQKIGCSHQSISKYENDENMEKIKVIQSLSEFFNVTTDYLIKGVQSDVLGEVSVDEEKFLSKYRDLSSHDREIVDYILNMEDTSVLPEPIQIQEVTKIIYKLPVYQQDVAAGSGQLGFDQKHHMEEFSEIDMPQKVSYGIKISGTSMTTDDENNIPDGSTVLVTTDFDTDDLIGEAVVVNIGGVLVCKEYNIAEDGHLWLKSRNPQKSDEDRHIYDIDRIKIIGKVVKVITSS